jgi:D-threonate/D-erythronate kinase
MNGGADLIEEWSEKICRELSENGKVIISVSHISENDLPISGRIRENMGIVVRRVTEKVKIDDLLIEGGATTSVILKYLEISRLFPFRELESGVIQMKTEKYPDLCITTKPGSYHWPEHLIFNDEKCGEKGKNQITHD